MHVEPPKAPIISLREFGTHYLMIVLSILTAIGLEEGLRFYHDRQAAADAEQAIERELRSNLDDLRDAIKNDKDRIGDLRQLGDETAEAIRQGGDQAVLKKKIGEVFHGKLPIGVSFPTLSRQAWDVAVASQAAAHIPRDKLEAYAAAYNVERDALQAAGSGMMMLDAPRMSDMGADFEIGAVDPKRFLEVAREALAMTGVGLGPLLDAEKEMVKALDKAGVSTR